MLIIPAIDIKEGACVRLKQGQFSELTQFAASPIERAHYFYHLGAQRIHLVDLDGAQTGTMQHLDLIQSMQSCGIDVQVGGGIRTQEQVETCFSVGINKVVLGSLASTNRPLTKRLINTFGSERIILALDVHIQDNIPLPATHGWQNISSINLWELVAEYQQAGLKHILCTDIACDGMMNGPNFLLYEQAMNKFPKLLWQASGGIRNEADIRRLDSLGISGAILGLTLYQNQFDLAHCLMNYTDKQGAVDAD